MTLLIWTQIQCTTGHLSQHNLLQNLWISRSLKAQAPIKKHSADVAKGLFETRGGWLSLSSFVVINLEFRDPASRSLGHNE
jgi:hypothetical protein